MNQNAQQNVNLITFGYLNVNSSSPSTEDVDKSGGQELHQLLVGNVEQ